MPFEFFDHTADIGVTVYGATLGELFESAAEAFTEIVTEPAEVRPDTSVAVRLEAPQLDLLLSEWLGELLYRFEIDRLLVRTTVVSIEQRGDGYHLDAVAKGETFDPHRHRIKVLVKAVTYHALEVVPTPDGWRATVVLDI